MEIRIGDFILKSDGFSMWLEEEYEGKDAKGRPKKQTRRVAGYAGNIDILLRQFQEHRHKNNDATTVAELLKVLKKTADDTELIKKTALKEDFKIIRRIGKQVKEMKSK